jgi:hypothetical protein
MPNKPDGPIGVFVAVFADDESADKGLEALRFYQRKAKIMDIYDDAKILRKDDGKIEVRGAIIAIADAKNMETFAGEVPNALRTFTHTFASANTDEIAEWISSIPETVRAESGEAT